VILDSEILEALNRFAANSEDLIFVVDEDLCIEYVNSSALRFVGAHMGEVKGKSYADFLPPGDRQLLDRNFRDVFESGKPASFENDFIWPDRAITLDVHVSPVRNGGPSVQGALAVARDITERRRQERLITRSKREWLRAVDGMPHMLAVVGTDYRIERVNQAMALRLKSTVRSAIGLSCHEQFHGTAELPWFCPFLNTAGGRDYSVEVVEPHLGGACMSNISSIKDEAGKTVGCLYVCRDISDRERALSATRSREEYMRMLLRSSEYAVYIQNTDGRYVYFNAMPGDRVPWGLIGSYPAEFFEPAVASRIVERVMEVAAQGTELAREIDFTWGGEVVRFFDRLSPVRDAMGRIKAVMTVSMKTAVFRHLDGQTPVLKSSLKRLSAREQEVLRLIARGLTSTQIAAGLSISKKTVETHRARIMEKLDLHKTSALVAYAAKAGLIQ